MTDRFDKYTERARDAFTVAQKEAESFHHNYIGTEHLLLGIIEVEGPAADILTYLGATPNKIRSAIEFIIGRGDRDITGPISLTPRSKKVIELAVDEATRLHHDYIGTEHLLAALIREGEGLAAGVLESMGITLERVRSAIIESRLGASIRRGNEKRQANYHKSTEVIPEDTTTEKQRAGRMLGEAWNNSTAPDLGSLMKALKVWERSGPSNVIEACAIFLSPKPLTDAEKLAKLRRAVSEAVQTDAKISFASIELLGTAMRETE